MKTEAVFLMVSLVIGTAQVGAAPIPGLFNTGVNNTPAALPAGSVDPHYTLIVNPDSASANALVHNEGFPIVPGAWLANSSASKWIAPRAATDAAAAGDYTYRLSFDLTGLDPASASISGRWTSDNAGADILINGVSTGNANAGNFDAFTAFSINSGFVAGINTLDFRVNNAGPAPGFTGLRVELSGTALPPGAPPLITVHPRNQCVSEGLDVTFSVTAQGIPPLTYRWRKDGFDLPDGGNPTFTLPPVFPDDAGNYDVVVGNDSGSVTSLVATLTVGLPMVNSSFEADTFTVFPGYVSGNGPITGWNALGGHGINPGTFGGPFSDNGAIPHGTKVAFLQQDGAMSQTVNGLTVGDTYYVQFYENSRLGDSPTDPGLAVTMGGVTIVAAHTIPPAGGSNPYRSVLSDVFTATSASMELSFIKSSPQAGDNTALIDNVCVVRIQSNSPPFITAQPVDQAAQVCDPVSFSAGAIGGLPLSYQWRKDGSPVPGATSATYSITMVSKLDEGNYSLRVTNSFGTATSRVARLTVYEPIYDLFNTGQDSDHLALTDGAVDPNYRLIQNPDVVGSPDAIVEDSTAFPIVAGPWLANTANSKWIGPRFDTTPSAVGQYIYRTTIDLTGRDLSTVLILGHWAVDNTGTEIRVNGTSTGNPQSPGFGAYTSFTLSSMNATFVAGINTIDFVVENVQSAGWTGLRVEFLTSNARILPGTAPRITRHPTPRQQEASEGSTVTFSGKGSGSAPLLYQWKKDGANLPGQTNPILTLSNVLAAASGFYTLSVSNTFGGDVSAPGLLCVNTRKIAGIFGTGLDNNSALLTSGAVDPHYTLTASADPSFPGPDAFVVNEEWPIAPIGPWLANGPTSKWIAPRAEQNQVGDPNFGNSAGNYTFRTTADLTGLTLSQVKLVGAWATDNSGLDILVNGASTGITSPGFGTFAPFTFTSANGLVAGANTLDFVMNNATAVTPVNPAGLRVDLVGLVDIPRTIQAATLQIVSVGTNRVRITWGPVTPCQHLQGASSVTGPWLPINGATSPFEFQPTGAMRFFRVAE